MAAREHLQGLLDFPTQGALLGIDYGLKRVGIALCTPDWGLASPLETYLRRDDRHDAGYYQQLARDYRTVGLVVGLPLHLAGHESQKSQEARRYAAWLTQVTGLPHRLWDERYTSSVAEEHLIAADLSRRSRKGRVDRIAAQIILQAFCDHHRVVASSANEPISGTDQRHDTEPVPNEPSAHPDAASGESRSGSEG